MRYVLAILLAMAPALTLADTPGHSPKSWQEYAYNNDNYNSNEKQWVVGELKRMDNTRDEQFRFINIKQGEQDANIKAVESASILGKGLIAIIVIGIPLWIKWQDNEKAKDAVLRAAQQKKDDDALEHRIARIDTLEHSDAYNDSRMELVTQLTQMMLSSSRYELHHDIGHPRADILLDKMDGTGILSHSDNAELIVLMKKREADPSVSEREQGAARDLPQMLEIVKKLRAITEEKREEAASAKAKGLA